MLSGRSSLLHAFVRCCQETMDLCMCVCISGQALHGNYVCWIEPIDLCWIEPNSVLLFHLLIYHVFLLLSVLFNVSYTGCMLSKFIYERC
jgi:hypothetical protein